MPPFNQVIYRNLFRTLLPYHNPNGIQQPEWVTLSLHLFYNRGARIGAIVIGSPE
jgi:hypothetical protein